MGGWEGRVRKRTHPLKVKECMILRHPTGNDDLRDQASDALAFVSV